MNNATVRAIRRACTSPSDVRVVPVVVPVVRAVFAVAAGDRVVVSNTRLGVAGTWGGQGELSGQQGCEDSG